MENYYVKCEHNVIMAWSHQEVEGYEYITSDSELFGILDCVRVEEGTAYMDEELKAQLANVVQDKSEIELLKEENEELRVRQEMTESTVLELADMILGGE